MTYTFMDRIGVLFDPRFWFRSAPVSRIYGRELETSMDLDDVSLSPWYGAETCRVGDDDVMVGDWSNYGQHVWFGVMPPRRTALRLREIVSDRQGQQRALANMAEDDAHLGLLNAGLDND